MPKEAKEYAIHNTQPNTNPNSEHLDFSLIKEAKRDIKDDNVTYKFAGGLQLPMYSQKNENSIEEKKIQKKGK